VRILLDTHIILWAVTDSPKLPESARKMILDERNRIYFSSASIWEVAIKHAMAPEQMPVSSQDLLQYAGQSGYEELPVSAEHAVTVETLPPVHKDPFDRILVAQAVAEPMRLLTHDRLLSKYSSCVFPV
jgi:PIN domain nuclease of toxin-antitoxin system